MRKESDREELGRLGSVDIGPFNGHESWVATRGTEEMMMMHDGLVLID